MKRILILGAPIFQIPVVQKAKEMGLFVGIVDINPNAPAFFYADEVFIESIRDKDAVLRIAEKFGPDGVICGTCDTSVVTAAYVCNKLGLQGLSEEVALKATNKLEMLYAFEQHGVAHPQFQLVKKANIKDFTIKIAYPAISKPVDSASGRGVNYIKCQDELQTMVKNSSSAGMCGDVLIEEYMDGLEVSVEVLVVEGKPYILQITDKITSGMPNFYEIGHSQPSVLSEVVQLEVKELAAKAVLAVGLINSPAHVEIKITKDGPKMVELGARMGGDCITTYLLNTSVSGINMAETTILMALGEKPNVLNYKNSGSAVGIKFIPAKGGILKKISNIEKVNAMEGIVKVEVLGKIGETYADARDNSARFGYIVAKGKTTEESLAICTKAIDIIDIEMN